jgi:Icc-related predicted phosphoesterase
MGSKGRKEIEEKEAYRPIFVFHFPPTITLDKSNEAVPRYRAAVL